MANCLAGRKPETKSVPLCGKLTPDRPAGMWKTAQWAENGGGKHLANWLQKFNTYKVYITRLLLPLNPGLNRRHASRDQTGGGDRRRRNRESNNFTNSQ